MQANKFDKPRRRQIYPKIYTGVANSGQMFVLGGRAGACKRGGKADFKQ